MQRTDEQCMAAYVAGEDRSFNELYRSFAPSLLRFFLRRGNCTADAQDLVQQTFLRVHRARQSFRSGEPLRPWLFAIARNTGHDQSRRRMRRPELLCDLALVAAPQLAGDELARRERARCVAVALEALEPDEQRLIDEHWLQERAWTEIATQNCVHASTLRVRGHRACNRLRALFSSESMLGA